MNQTVVTQHTHVPSSSAHAATRRHTWYRHPNGDVYSGRFRDGEAADHVAYAKFNAWHLCRLARFPLWLLACCALLWGTGFVACWPVLLVTAGTADYYLLSAPITHVVAAEMALPQAPL